MHLELGQGRQENTCTEHQTRVTCHQQTITKCSNKLSKHDVHWLKAILDVCRTRWEFIFCLDATLKSLGSTISWQQSQQNCSKPLMALKRATPHQLKHTIRLLRQFFLSLITISGKVSFTSAVVWGKDQNILCLEFYELSRFVWATAVTIIPKYEPAFGEKSLLVVHIWSKSEVEIYSLIPNTFILGGHSSIEWILARANIEKEEDILTLIIIKSCRRRSITQEVYKELTQIVTIFV